MTKEITSITDSDESYRVLIAASDAESVSLDSLEVEADTVRASMADYANNTLQVKTVSTLDQDVFVAKLKDFRPNIVHFTNRGSAQPYIRMISGGWIRQVTGRTLVKLFFKAECAVQTIVLINCSVFREEAFLLAKSDYILSIKSRYPTFGVSSGVIRELYSCLGIDESYGRSFNRFFEFASRQTPDSYLDFKVRGKEAPEGLSEDWMSSFLFWDMRKSFVEPDADDERVSEDAAARPSSADQFQLVAGETAKRSGSEEDKGDLAITDDGRRLYRVWFGTNRKPIGAIGNGEFGSDRDDVTHYGCCDVLIPKHHKIGQISDPWLKRWLWSGESNSLRIESRENLDIESFYRDLRKVYEDLPEDEDNLLVFLHGYNVSFDDAAIRAAQFGIDLGVKGTTAFFSWPSKGTFFGYMADEATIEASEDSIAKFLIGLSENSGATKIHLIAHSMGNRGLLRAMNSMLLKVQKTIGKKIDQIFLAAPDVDAKVFGGLAKVYDQTCNRATMYVSAKDMALWGSSFFHAYERAGYIPPVTVVPNIDTVRVPRLNLDLIGHGYVADAKEVLTDMYTLMTSDSDPDKRFGLEKKQTVNGEDYWLVKV